MKQSYYPRYYPRIADRELADRLESAGVVVIEGPKACGKTAMARQVAESEVLLDVDENARRAIAVDPELVLTGAAPRLIDEWQVEPTIWNHVRRIADQRQQSGQLILTGSAVPADDITRHTGAGRISRLRLRPMSLTETGFSSAEVSLLDLYDRRFSGSGDPGHKLIDITEQLCRGGWPGVLNLSLKASLRARRDYLDEIRRVDVGRVDGLQRDPDKVARVIRSLARNVATEVSAATIAADAGGVDGPLNDNTVRDYLSALARLMVCEEQPAWPTHLRSKASQRRSAKRHFVDPSLAVAALRTSPRRLLQDLKLLGQLFESLVFRELNVYAGAADADVYHYRDNTGLEVDAIVQRRNGDWCAFEVKLGAGYIDEAATTLLKFRDRLDLDKCGEPKTLGVIVSSGYGYRREDGVVVIPIGALGP